MSRSRQFTERAMIAAIVDADGDQPRAAQLLGCSVQTIRNYRKLFPRVDAAFANGKTDLVRRVALTAYELALGEEGWKDDPEKRQPDPRMTMFVLKTQGQWRERDRLSVDFTVIQETVAALENSGRDPAVEFESLIQKARDERNTDADGIDRRKVMEALDAMVARKRSVEANGHGGMNGRR